MNQDETGIHYGYIAANDLDSELLDTLMYGFSATNLTEKAAIAEETARQRSEWEDECEHLSVAAQEAGTDCVLDDFEPDLENFELCIDEPIIEGVYEEVHYRSSWLGGALNFWVLRSPLITTKAGRASPCVPGAGILPAREDGDVTCYDVPPDWLHREPDDGINFSQRLEDQA